MYWILRKKQAFYNGANPHKADWPILAGAGPPCKENSFYCYLIREIFPYLRQIIAVSRNHKIRMALPFVQLVAFLPQKAVASVPAMQQTTVAHFPFLKSHRLDIVITTVQIPVMVTY